MNCLQPFRRLVVERTTNFGVRVWWEISSDFFDRTPHVFQLQHSYSGLPAAIDWTNVGSTAIDAVLLTDDEPREQGKVLISYYRIKLATPDGQYVSDPTSCRAGIDYPSWLLAKEITRKEVLRFQRARSGTLLKRRRYGELCTCLDPLTKEVRDSDCQVCYGTGFLGGYHKPFRCAPFEIPEEVISEKQQPAAGTSRNDVLTARVLGNPMLQRLDILADANSDERYHVQDVKIAAAVGNLPIVLQVSLLPLPFSHVAYRLSTNP